MGPEDIDLEICKNESGSVRGNVAAKEQKRKPDPERGSTR